jgi:FAD/FMN-containing dehydrogenase
MRLSRRSLIVSAASLLAASKLGPARAAARRPAPARPFVLNDASRLNPVPVAAHVTVRSSEDERVIAQLRALLQEAAQDNQPVALHGARHSMGGQCLPRNGVAATLSAPRCELDTAAKTCRVRSGMRWSEVIAALDPHGFSPAVMQSNHDFSVGGTLSVNAHGWPVPFGPFGATVRSFRLMLADGSIVTCSRDQNAELFHLAVGGYGLFGIVLDIELALAENVLLAPTYEVMPAARVARHFVAAVRDPAVRMAYGRLSVDRARFLEEAMVVSYRPTAEQPSPLPGAQRSGAYSFLSRAVFRQQIGSDRGKRARWYAETALLPRVAKAHPLTRNTVLNYPVAVLRETDPRRTDILHEYFVPAERFGDFLLACREVIAPSGQDLLNVTLRHVEADPAAVLSFAPGPRIAAVMLFNQAATPAADAAMQRMTEQLIDRVLALGGSFYLPYRLHARGDQLRAAYPRLDDFIARKQHYDPQLRFRNLMWDKYFA